MPLTTEATITRKEPDDGGSAKNRRLSHSNNAVSVVDDHTGPAKQLLQTNTHCIAPSEHDIPLVTSPQPQLPCTPTHSDTARVGSLESEQTGVASGLLQTQILLLTMLPEWPAGTFRTGAEASSGTSTHSDAASEDSLTLSVSEPTSSTSFDSLPDTTYGKRQRTTSMLESSELKKAKKGKERYVDKPETDQNEKMVAQQQNYGDYTETTDSRQSSTPEPIVCDCWTLREEFSAGGGSLQGDRSDVCLHIPEGAVGGRPKVEIRGAICTDTERGHTVLGLPQNEVIVSPLVEYSTQPDLYFAKPVRIQLPHFLPPGFSEQDVRVYQFFRDESGLLFKQVLQRQTPVETDTDVADKSAVYSFDHKTRCVNILTSHFSGYVCTTCSENYTNPEFCVEVYARDVEKGGGDREVDVLMRVWDKRLAITDFLEGRGQLPNMASTEGLRLVDYKVLDPLPEDIDVRELQLNARLELRRSEDHNTWRHAILPNTRDFVHQTAPKPVKSFVPCGCLRECPWRVEWTLETGGRPPPPRDQFECYVILEYLSNGQPLPPHVQSRVTVHVRNIKTTRQSLEGPSWLSAMPEEFRRMNPSSSPHEDIHLRSPLH